MYYIDVKGKPLDRVPFRSHQTAIDSLAFLLLSMEKILNIFVDENGDTIDVFTISKEYLEIYWVAKDHKK